MTTHRSKTSARERYAALPSNPEPHIRLGLYRVVHGGGCGRDRLSVEFFGDPPHNVVLDYMLAVPALALPFAQAIGHWGSQNGKRKATRQSMREHLKIGFFTFLIATDRQEITIDGLNESIARQFTSWLDLQHNKKGQPLTVGTKYRLYQALIINIKVIASLPNYKNNFSTRIILGSNPWPDRERRTKPTKVLTDTDRDHIFIESAKIASATMHRVEKRWKIIDENIISRNEILKYSSSQLATYDRCLLRFEASANNKLVSLHGMRSIDKDLYNSWNKLTKVLENKKIHSITDSYQPFLSDLIPFILLLAMYTGFNRSVLLHINVNDIEFTEVLGQKKIKVSSVKERGNSLARTEFPMSNQEVHPARLIAFLIRWTSRIRENATGLTQQRLFAYASERKYTPLSIDERAITWTQAFSTFRKNHNLPYFSLRELRQTHLEQVRDITRDDPYAVAEHAGHKGIDVQDRHYTSDAARQRNAEKIGHFTNLHSRWVTSRGRIDPRGTTLEDLGAATPGFHCFDPYDSPQPGQSAGQLCTAYGACVTCPLAAVDTHSPYALAFLLLFRASVEDGRSTVASPSWVSSWAPRLERLSTFWLPAFTRLDVIEAARSLTLPPLPPVGYLE